MAFSKASIHAVPAKYIFAGVEFAPYEIDGQIAYWRAEIPGNIIEVDLRLEAIGLTSLCSKLFKAARHGQINIEAPTEQPEAATINTSIKYAGGVAIFGPELVERSFMGERAGFAWTADGRSLENRKLTALCREIWLSYVL